MEKESYSNVPPRDQREVEADAYGIPEWIERNKIQMHDSIREHFGQLARLHPNVSVRLKALDRRLISYTVWSRDNYRLDPS